MMFSRKSLIIIFLTLLAGGAAAYFYIGHQSSPKKLTAKRSGVKANIDSSSYLCICAEGAVLYKDNKLREKLCVLHPGDEVESVRYRDDETAGNEEILFSDTIYRVKAKSSGSYVKGYIKGKYIGKGKWIDVSGSGKKVLAALRYKKYDPEDDLEYGEAEMVIIDNGKILASIPFKAYDALSFEPEDTLHSFPGYRFLMAYYGERACDYPNGELLLYYHNNKLDSVCHNTVAAGEAGYYADSYYFPRDSGGKAGRIIVEGSLGYNRENMEPEDTAGIHDQTDSMIYLLKGDKLVLERKNTTKLNSTDSDKK